MRSAHIAPCHVPLLPLTCIHASLFGQAGRSFKPHDHNQFWHWHFLDVQHLYEQPLSLGEQKMLRKRVNTSSGGTTLSLLCSACSMMSQPVWVSRMCCFPTAMACATSIMCASTPIMCASTSIMCAPCIHTTAALTMSSHLSWVSRSRQKQRSQ